MNAQELTLAGLAVVPLIVGVTELAKAYVGGHYAPLVALGLGLAAGVASQATLSHPVWINGVVIGIAAGLSASGVYSSVDAFVSSRNDAPASQPPAPRVENPNPLTPDPDLSGPRGQG